MKSFVVILSCFAAVAIANPAQNTVEYLANGQCRVNCRPSRPGWPIANNECPPVNCPPAVIDPNCGAPICNNGNRWALHPHPDPNFFYQCAPRDAVSWWAVVQPCACGTVFSLDVNPPRCVHPWEWRPHCPGQQNPPVLNQAQCRPDCPTCDDGPQTPPPVTLPPPTLPPPTVEPPVTTPPPNGCPCPCLPCIWWPCRPCLSNCACNNQQQPQQPQPQPIPEPPQTPQWPPQQNPRPQPPTWDQPSWDRPSWDQPSWDQPSWDQPSWDQPSWNQPQAPQNPWQRW